MNTKKQNIEELSIRIKSNGFSFSEHKINNELFFESPEIVDSNEFLLALEKAIYHFMLPNCSLKKITIEFANTPFTLVPKDKVKEKDYSYFLPEKKENESILLNESIDSYHSTLLYRVPKKLYYFLVRTFPESHFSHILSKQLSEFYICTTTHPKSMFVCYSDTFLTLIYTIDNGKIIANQYNCLSINDAIYYIMYCCEQNHFDRLHFPIYIDGKVETLKENLKEYIEHIFLIKNDPKKIKNANN